MSRRSGTETSRAVNAMRTIGALPPETSAANSANSIFKL